MSRLATMRQRALYEAREIWKGNFRTFDSETTGLGPEDQIIQWAVCDQEGTVLGSGYIKPTEGIEISEGAFDKHGISLGQLRDAPTFAEVWPTICNLLVGQVVVIYNANFDVGKIYGSAHPYQIEIPAIKTRCAMELFARFYGEIHEYYGTYTWQKLGKVTSHLKIEVPGNPHNAEYDAAVTAMIIKKLAELADKELPTDWHPPVMVPCAGGCNVVQECVEADEIWYCSHCGLERGIYHQCPGCNRLMKVSATGIICEDICTFCHERLHQEMMLLTGAWHLCPKHNYPHIVKTPDLEERCDDCKQQLEWKRKIQEDEQRRKEREEQARKERRREYAKEYYQRRKDRIARGLPPTEPKPPGPETFTHHNHSFQWRTNGYNRREVYCSKCESTWSRPPQRYCLEIKTYWSWEAIPEHLKTRTQLKRLHLQPAKDQKHEAAMMTSFDWYGLYDQGKCVPIKKKKKHE